MPSAHATVGAIVVCHRVPSAWRSLRRVRQRWQGAQAGSDTRLYKASVCDFPCTQKCWPALMIPAGVVWLALGLLPRAARGGDTFAKIHLALQYMPVHPRNGQGWDVQVLI